MWTSSGASTNSAAGRPSRSCAAWPPSCGCSAPTPAACEPLASKGLPYPLPQPGYTRQGMELTPMMRQYQEAKARYPDAILFFHLGDFYETFFEDAELVARELDITLTQRDGHPMAGVPVRKAEVYIHRLLKRGYKVALCQQLERPGKDKKLLKRAVVRVLTPGTILEEEALEAGQDMYLAALWPEGDKVGVAWAEAASGEFSGAELPPAELPNLVARLSVREWLLPEGWQPPCELPGAHTLRPREDFSAAPLESRFPGA
ncbi:TPA: hypothetical protein EYH33_01095, partial [Candidatus Bipolaricaulota bacterium]|nr:hypothetical protein [Candidatus Bipolaricaulota bacterium]